MADGGDLTQIEVERFCRELRQELSEMEQGNRRVSYINEKIESLPAKFRPLATMMFFEGQATKPAPDFMAHYPLLGSIFGGITVFFLMALVWVKGFGDTELNATGKLALRFLMSFSAAMSFNFVGGKASAEGKIPIPFAKEAPVSFGIAGGFAVFVIIFLLTSSI